MGRSVVLLVVCALLLGGAVVMGQRQREGGGGGVAGLVSDARAAAVSEAPAGRLDEVPAAAPVPADGGARASSAEGAAGAGDPRVVELAVPGVVMPVPEGFGLAADAADEEDAANVAARASCPMGFDYCVYAADDGEPSATASLGVKVRRDLESEAECVLDPLPGFEDSLPAVSGTRDHVAARFGSVTASTAGQVETLGLRRLRYRGLCYEFVARVVAPVAETAEDASRELAAIVDGVTLPDGRSELWAGGR